MSAEQWQAVAEKASAAAFSSQTEREEFLQRARELLRDNDMGDFVKPGRFQYPHQWNWDAALVALGLSHFDLERAHREVRSLLRGQWRGGMLPHVVYHNGESDYFPTPAFWQTQEADGAPESVATSGLVQPPLLATCVRLIHERHAAHPASRPFLEEVYPKLLAWHRWLHGARDPERTGLVAIIHPWESGTDNAARWVQPLSEISPQAVPNYERRDKQHVHHDERPLHVDYERFIYLIDRFRSWGYDPQTIYARSPFLVQDTLFNAVLHRANLDLRELALELGESTEEIDGWRRRLARAFNAKLYDDEQGLYFAYDARHHRLIRENGIAAFMALYAGLADDEQADRLIDDHLLQASEYAPDGATSYWVPTQAKNNYFFEPRRYWRGPVWIITNWLVSEGLARYGRHELAAEIRRQSLELMLRSGFVEYYDPRDGSPAGAVGFSWSAALALEIASR